MRQTNILIIPGRGNSGSGHWQTIVEETLPGTLRVQQENWDTPSLEAWAHNIDHAVRQLDHRPLLVAHSFGCLAAAYAQTMLGTPAGASLFVAPADPERFGLPRWLFSERLPRPGMLIASSNDSWLSLEKARHLAADWGVEFLDLGPVGHINAASGHGSWPLGTSFIESMRRELDNTRVSPIHRSIALSGRERCASHKHTKIKAESFAVRRHQSFAA